MSEFKPMVKMYTDEPSVLLKLKKGGKVSAKHHKEGGSEGHKPMHHHAHAMHKAMEAEHGSSPKKPSMMDRHKAMNPNLYKKGGKVAHKLVGGAMPMAAPAGAMRPMGAAAIGQMAPAARAARAAMVRRALSGMKKGGSADHKMIEKLEKELHHHESLPLSKAHHKASGGAIDRDETRTTIEKGAKKFAKTFVVDGDHKDRAHGTGEVLEGNGGGYAHGGKVHRISGHPEGSHEHHKHMAKHYAEKHKEGGSAHHKKMHEHHKSMCKGGSYAKGGNVASKIPADTHEGVNKGKIKLGGTIEDNEHYYENTDMHTAKADHSKGATGGVRMGNAGGFRHGGKAHKMHHKASGGAIDKYDVRDTVEGGNWENRPADTAKKGKTNTKTGEVKLANAGGYKHGGHAAKKHYATGGNVIKDGEAKKMPHHFVSRPVANSLQSGTFAKGGKVETEDKPRLRLAKTHTGPQGHKAKVYKDLDWNEHRVKFFDREGKHLPRMDYHTDDPEDAHDTARHVVEGGLYKRGGKISRKAEGGSQSDDAQTQANNKAYADWEKSVGAENEADRNIIPNALRKTKEGIMGLFGSKPPSGSVTKTEKSVTVAPPKRRGGLMR